MQLELSVTCNPTNILFFTSYSFFIFLKGAFTRIVLTRMIDIVVFSTLNVFFFCVLFISSGDGHALQRDIVKKLWRMFSSMVASLTMFRRQIVACLTEEEEKEKTTTW